MKREMITRFVGPTLVVYMLVLAPIGVKAIPTFARKYETSCQTCHVVYPKLTPFGEAFRQNGFQWPGDIENDEANVKEKPVPLGAQAYKRVFPDAVWPGAIPGKAPISFRARSGFTWEKHDDEVRAAFEPPTLQVVTGGTLGDNVGFFVGAHLFEEGSFDGASVDRFYLQLNNVLSGRLPDNSLYLRFGQFIPEMVPFASNHRGLTLTSYAFNTYYPASGPQFAAGHIHGDGEDGHEENGHGHSDAEELIGPRFGIENFQLGIEASGIMNRRFRYVVGLVNGGTGQENNLTKDGYFRLTYKFGGMAFDGSGGGNESAKNWVDNSFAFGIFGYRGWAFNEETSLHTDLKIERLGLDFNWFWRDLNIYGGLQQGSDETIESHGDDHIYDTDGGTESDLEVGSVDFNVVFAEANYVLYPWLVGILRFEEANSNDFDSIRRIVLSLSILYRANIKFVLETRLDPDNLELTAFQLGLDFGY